MWWIPVAAAVSVILVLAAVYVALLQKNPNRNPEQHIDDRNGFVKARGTNLYDGNGDLLQFRGVNLGNWLVQEHWMAVSSCDGYDTGLYTQKRGMAALRENKNITEKQADELETLYTDTYIRESDFAQIASLGLNTVRIVFSYLNLTVDGERYRENAFRYLDFAVEMCRKYGLYAILDLHGAPGSQNKDIHSGDDSQFDLYGNERNRRLTAQLWRTVAARYKDNKTVAAYDLLNEPRRKAGKFGGKINFDFYDELYKAVREVDTNHLILIECFSFPNNGGKIKDYAWENVCMEYHIYNLVPVPQKTCLGFYNVLHNLTGNKTAVYIGEWNAFLKERDWYKSIKYFNKMGWSYSSWTYKTNKYFYKHYRKKRNWGVFELDMPPVNLYTATFDEIRNAYLNVGTEHAAPSLVHKVYQTLKGDEN